MKKYLFTIIFIIVIFTATIKIYAVAIGGAEALRNQGSARGGGGFGRGGIGGRGMAGPVQRPDKAARLASIAEIEKQITALRAIIQKAPATDPNISTLEGEKQETFVEQYNEESEAINQIVQAINTIRPVVGGRGMMGGGINITTEQIKELTALAKEDKATKLVTRLEVLAKEVEAAGARGGLGGRGGTSGESTTGGFEWVD